MTPRSFVYLAAAAAVSVLLAIVSFASNNQWSSGLPEGKKLLSGLADAIRSVAQIEIRQGDDKVVLQKTSGSWAMKTRAGYPVDVRKVGTLLVALGEAELVERKTARPDRYAALELEDPAGKGAKSRLVRLTDAKGKTIHEVVIGKRRVAGYGLGKTSGTYVRRPGAPQTWLASIELDASLAVKDWVKTSVLTMDAAKVSRISIEIPGQDALTAERPAAGPAAAKEPKGGDEAKESEAKAKALETAKTKAPAAPAKLAFVGFPAAGQKLKDAGAAEDIARAVSSIDLEDVRKLEAPPTAKGISVVRVERAGGPATTLRLRKDGDAHWLSVTATGEGDAKKTADAITARTQGWEFKIPSWKANAILKKRADLIEAPAS